MTKLSAIKMNEFQQELTTLLLNEGYTKEQVDCLLFTNDQYVRFAHPQFAEWVFTVHDVNDKDRMDNNVDRDLIDIEETASRKVFGFSVHSLYAIDWMVDEARYQKDFAEEKMEYSDSSEERAGHRNDAKCFNNLILRGAKMLDGKLIQRKERIGFRRVKNGNPNRAKYGSLEWKDCRCPYWVYLGENGESMDDPYFCKVHNIGVNN